MASESKAKLDEGNRPESGSGGQNRACRSGPAIGKSYQGGGSAAAAGGSSGGGGYLETCTASKADGSGAGAPAASRVADPIAELGAGDPRIEELRECGLNPLWVRMAEYAGFERFIAMWSMLDQAEPVLDDRRRLYVPCLERTFLRHQRDQLISALARAGMGPAEIEQRLGPLRSTAGISLRTIERIHARALDVAMRDDE